MDISEIMFFNIVIVTVTYLFLLAIIMMNHRDYLGVFDAGCKLFGPGYSGLEYDYRGLLRLYQFTGNTDKAYEYSLVLHDWNRIRDHTNSEEKCPLELTMNESVTDVVHRFFAAMATDS